MDMFESKNIKPMLIGEHQEAFNSIDYIYELKLDGERCIAYLDKDTTELRNKRNIKMLVKSTRTVLDKQAGQTSLYFGW